MDTIRELLRASKIADVARAIGSAAEKSELRQLRKEVARSFYARELRPDDHEYLCNMTDIRADELHVMEAALEPPEAPEARNIKGRREFGSKFNAIAYGILDGSVPVWYMNIKTGNVKLGSGREIGAGWIFFVDKVGGEDYLIRLPGCSMSQGSFKDETERGSKVNLNYEQLIPITALEHRDASWVALNKENKAWPSFARWLKREKSQIKASKNVRVDDEETNEAADDTKVSQTSVASRLARTELTRHLPILLDLVSKGAKLKYSPGKIGGAEKHVVGVSGGWTEPREIVVISDKDQQAYPVPGMRMRSATAPEENPGANLSALQAYPMTSVQNWPDVPNQARPKITAFLRKNRSDIKQGVQQSIKKESQGYSQLDIGDIKDCTSAAKVEHKIKMISLDQGAKLEAGCRIGFAEDYDDVKAGEVGTINSFMLAPTFNLLTGKRAKVAAANVTLDSGQTLNVPIELEAKDAVIWPLSEDMKRTPGVAVKFDKETRKFEKLASGEETAQNIFTQGHSAMINPQTIGGVRSDR